MSGTQGNDGSYNPSISADGRYVAFQSYASNLVTGDTNGFGDIFVHDRNTQVTTRVSVNSSGIQASNNSYYPSISGDGRYVAFWSTATNLVPGDTNGFDDVFLHDRNTGQTTRISVNSTGIQANSHSYDPSVSADGRYVAFRSFASDLVTGDTNGFQDVFVHDTTTGQTTRVSVNSIGMDGTGPSGSPSISGDGRFMAFDSSAPDLVTGDTNGWTDVFVHDRNVQVTTRVSVATGGSQATGGSSRPSISADGRYVAFESYASDLVTGDIDGNLDIYVHDRLTGQTSRVSVTTGGTEVTGVSDSASISGDGRQVAFLSDATDLVSGDTNGFKDVFVHTDAIRHNAVFRPSASDNWIFTHNLTTVSSRDHYGSATDKPLVCDFNNDGTMDRAVFRNGEWIFDYSMDGDVDARSSFGMAGDVPLAGQFNGDRIMDRSVFRNGEWIFDYDLDGDVDARSNYGMAGDVPFCGDSNRDGITDRVVFRRGEWIFDLGMDGTVDSRNYYGMSTDIPLIGLIDGNTLMDRAAFRNGEWIMDFNMDGSVNWRPQFGTTGDIPLNWVET